MTMRECRDGGKGDGDGGLCCCKRLSAALNSMVLSEGEVEERC